MYSFPFWTKYRLKFEAPTVIHIQPNMLIIEVYGQVNVNFTFINSYYLSLYLMGLDPTPIFCKHVNYNSNDNNNKITMLTI